MVGREKIKGVDFLKIKNNFCYTDLSGGKIGNFPKNKK